MSDAPRQHVGPTIRREVALPATPREAFDAWAEPEQISQWWVDRAEGRCEPGADISWHFDSFGAQPVHVLEAEPGHRLVFGGDGPPGMPPYLMELEFSDGGDGATLNLAQSGFAESPIGEDMKRGCESGWDLSLAALTHWLGTDRQAARDHRFVMRALEAEDEALSRAYMTTAGLERWLGSAVRSANAELREGDDIALDVTDAGPLTGRVVKRTPTELLLGWPEANGMLTLKVFSMGPAGRHVGLDLNGWPLPEAIADTTWMTAALERLSSSLS